MSARAVKLLRRLRKLVCDGERDRIAFAIYITLIGVDLVEEDVARGH